MKSDEEQLRVAVLRNQFLPYSETFIHDELRHHERYRPTVLARNALNEDRFSGHEVVAITSKSRPAPWASLWYGTAARSRVFDTALEAQRYALIHAHFLHNGAYALGFARRHRLPLVVSAHGHDVTVLLGRERYKPEWWFFLARYRRLFAEATLFLAASSELAELLEGLGCPSNKLRVCRLGIDLQAMKPAAEPPAGLSAKVVMVGRFVEKKGHLDGIRAVALARAEGLDVSLVIVGTGPLQSAYQALIDELALTPHVRFTGSLAHADVLREIAEAKVLLAPSVIAKNLDRESGIIVAKEAAALGLPVVGTLHGGLPEIVEDGVTGFLVPEHAPEALAKRLVELLKDEPRRRAFGVSARQKMLAEYDIRACVRKLETHYDEARRLFSS
jgi:glycosyltransferase involved in cell wall biosynthesis